MLHRIRPQYVAHEVHQLMGGIPLRHLEQGVFAALVEVLVAIERVGPEGYAVGMVPGRVLGRPAAMRWGRLSDGWMYLTTCSAYCLLPIRALCD